MRLIRLIRLIRLYWSSRGCKEGATIESHVVKGDMYVIEGAAPLESPRLATGGSPPPSARFAGSER